jgi:hypothetical protein
MVGAVVMLFFKRKKRVRLVAPIIILGQCERDYEGMIFVYCTPISFGEGYGGMAVMLLLSI